MTLHHPDLELGSSTLSLRIKSSRDITVQVRPHDTIATLKTTILQGLDQTDAPYIRLIAAGRLLAPDAACVRDFALASGSVVHAVVSHKRGAQAAAATSGSRLRRGTGINAEGWAVRSSAEEDDSSHQDEEDHNHPRLGLDRLRDTIGFRRTEVASIRTYFNPSIDRWIREHPQQAMTPTIQNEPDLVRRRLLQEDAWMQSQGPASEFRINLGRSLPMLRNHPNSTGGSITMGTDRDFLWGFLLGFFVGFMMLLWVWLPTVPHKQKLGILTGISLQLALSMWEGSEADLADDLVLTDY